MTTWIELTSKQAHFRYRVPLELASDEHNTFYGTQRQPESSPYDDGPWCFLAFLNNPKEERVITFQIYTIEFDFLEFKDFNPLEAQSGYLYLKRQEVLDLVDLLLKHAATLRPFKMLPGAMFRKLSGSEFTGFNLHSEWFKFGACYSQEFNPLSSKIESTEQIPMKTLVTLSGGTKPTSQITFSINQFPLAALNATSFNPLDNSHGRIHLDKNGLQELAELLKLYLKSSG